MNRRVLVGWATGCALSVVLAGCSDGSSKATDDPSGIGTVVGTPTQLATERPTQDLPTSNTAPPGVSTAVLHDLTDSNSARMLGVWEDTAVLASTDSVGNHQLTGWSTETGERVWSQTISPTLGAAGNLSQTTVELSYDAVVVFEVWAKDRLDKLAHLTLIDPTTGLTRSSQEIPAFRSQGTTPPWGVFVQPWSKPIEVYLPDGRKESLPKNGADWFLATPPGTPLWSGAGEGWPSNEQYEDSVGTDSVTWDRAIRRYDAGDGRRGIQVIDTKARQNVAEGCVGKTGSTGTLVTSPHRTWAAFGGTAIELKTATIHCNPEVFTIGGQVLAINDEGRMFGYSGTPGINEEYFLTTPDGEITVLAPSADSTFDPTDEDLGTTLAMTEDYLVVDGRMFALPE